MARKWDILGRVSDLYVGKSTLFKTFLLAGVAAISILFSWYTLGLINKLQVDTRDQVEKYVQLWQLAANSPTSGGELQFIFDEIIVKARFPIIVLDGDKKPVSWRNISGIAPDDTTTSVKERLREIAQEMYDQNGEFPLYFGDTYVNFLRYGDSQLINQLKVMPFVAIGIVLAFMIVAIVGFQNIRRSEERYIWVGMAKETAHQLGTPLSSLMGWLEVIGSENRSGVDAANQQEISDTTIDNMKVDVERLLRVTNRFSQIGSIPELKECDLNALAEDAVVYYRRRLPFEGKGIRIDLNTGDIPPVRLNAELFGWVLENLIKNALQAVDARSGRISITTKLAVDKRHVQIEIVDNGNGISTVAARKIFRPGFTTKKRGWGMGLTLVKRIVEEYHVGRIVLDRSQPGETVFEITLPVAGR
ncbi:MAG: two-component sensor histidine kinase [Candidatus Zixiibacteriota bacterium]|nr:MAG: two-component sensor histidine kinase [candidate division Zixibacteria bacterium]